MCGISGSYGFGAATEDITRRMNAALAHRGPDGEGVFHSGQSGLAHRRLSILDIEHGAQPMTTQDGRFTIVYNGEVYNYLELRSEEHTSELQSRGHLVVRLLLAKKRTTIDNA